MSECHSQANVDTRAQSAKSQQICAPLRAHDLQNALRMYGSRILRPATGRPDGWPDAGARYFIRPLYIAGATMMISALRLRYDDGDSERACVRFYKIYHIHLQHDGTLTFVRNGVCKWPAKSRHA